MHLPKHCTAILLLLAFTAFSCDKEDGLSVQKDVATLTWSGPYAADGCEFSIQLHEKKYKPENEKDIPASMKLDKSMSVEIRYVLPGKKIEYVCGLTRQQDEAIRILSIKEN